MVKSVLRYPISSSSRSGFLLNTSLQTSVHCVTKALLQKLYKKVSCHQFQPNGSTKEGS